MKFEYFWRNKWLTSDCQTIDDFIERYSATLDMFKEWKENGISLNKDSGIEDDYATFETENEEYALDNGFEPEEEDEEDLEEEEEL